VNDSKPTVLVFAGSDPSGGAGISADILAVAAQGAHALPVITALTVQDNDRVYAVHPVAEQLIVQQAQTLADKISIHAIKIGIVANRVNALALANWISQYRSQHPDVHVILDPVLASGHGDLLSTDSVVDALAPLLEVATVITPNLSESAALCPGALTVAAQAAHLMQNDAHVLIKGGHGSDALVVNTWFHRDRSTSWQFPRLPGNFHGSGCTLASALAGQLALGHAMHHALDAAQNYCHQSLQHSYAIASGQRIPQRTCTS
jgi:hydroxymethylpyrimidine/phosphomethylpyrimidine kinase